MRYLLLVFLIPALLNAYPRMVLGELFTSSTCGPCYNANNYLDELYPEIPERVVLIRYHVWWPAPGDPFYEANVEQNRTRTNFYGINSVPSLVIDGVESESGYSGWESELLDRAGISSPAELILQFPEFGLANITINTTADFPEGDKLLYLVITEDSIHYHASNGQTIFHQVMRYIFPDDNGQGVFVPADGSVQVEIPWYLDFCWDPANLKAVAFLQDGFTREVYQATVSALPSPEQYSYRVFSEKQADFIPPSEEGVFDLRIVNIGISSDNYHIEIERDSLGDGWEVELSDGWSSGDSYDLMLPPVADTTFSVIFHSSSEGGQATAEISVESEALGESRILNYRAISNTRILLVDNTVGGVSPVKSILADMPYPYAVWERADYGVANPTGCEYDLVILDSGNREGFVIEGPEQNYITSHLTLGRGLFIASNSLGAQLDGSGFYRVFLESELVGSEEGSIAFSSVVDNPITSGTITASVESTRVEFINPAGSASAFLTTDSERTVGTIGGRWNFVYLSFPLQFMEPPEIRNTLIDNIIGYLLETTDIKEEVVNTDGNLNIYPNPANGIAVINADAHIGKVTVNDILGRKVGEIYLDKGKGELNTADYTSGLYLLKAGKLTSPMVIIK